MLEPKTGVGLSQVPRFLFVNYAKQKKPRLQLINGNYLDRGHGIGGWLECGRFSVRAVILG